jgi:hypothetical protein
MTYNKNILLFEDFYEGTFDELNEVNQDTVPKLNAMKTHYAKRSADIKAGQAKISVSLAKIKARQGKTKDPASQKIYQARAAEESAKQELSIARLEAIQLALKVVNQKITVANLRLQAKAKREA